MKQCLIWLLATMITQTAIAQRNKYYTAMPHDSGMIYFIKPVEMKVEASHDDFYVDWAANYTTTSKCRSNVYMNFSIFTKNKPADADTAYIILNSGRTITAANFITEKRKKGIWKLRYTGNVELADVKNIFNEQGELLFMVTIDNQKYFLHPASKWKKTTDFMEDVILMICP